MICSSQIYLLVYSQTFDVTSDKKEVSGVEGGSAVLQWNVERSDESIEIVSANLELVVTPKKILYRYTTNEKQLADQAEVVFPKRSSAVFKNGTTYIFTLQNLSYQDANSFKFEVLFKAGDFISKNATIKLFVKGILHIIFFVPKNVRTISRSKFLKLFKCSQKLSVY